MVCIFHNKISIAELNDVEGEIYYRDANLPRFDFRSTNVLTNRHLVLGLESPWVSQTVS